MSNRYLWEDVQDVKEAWNAFMFPEPGYYVFHFFVDSQEVGIFPLHVQKPSASEISGSSDQQKL